MHIAHYAKDAGPKSISKHRHINELASSRMMVRDSSYDPVDGNRS